MRGVAEVQAAAKGMRAKVSREGTMLSPSTITGLPVLSATSAVGVTWWLRTTHNNGNKTHDKRTTTQTH